MGDNEDKFISILENHKGIIYKITNSYCKNKSDQQDLMQEIILQLWKSYPKYDNQYKLSTWIYRIALNTSISNYRKNKVRKEKTTELTPILTTSVNEVSPKEEEKYSDLQKFIKELKEIDKAIILLYLEGLSQKEISKIMGITSSNVSTRINRIKISLKQKFNTKNHSS